MSVEITLEPFTAGRPTPLFEGNDRSGGRGGPTNDVMPGGHRFVFVKESAEKLAVTQLNVVLNWFEELKQNVPVQ